ncbi:MAG: Rsd/AlgQ family anti-sigma factor [Pseudomonadota bacterium]
MTADNADKLNHAIEGWLQERQELIVLYCSVCGVHQQIIESPTKIQRLKTFCQILVDYCSAGHFEVFPELIKQAATGGDESSTIANSLLGKIQDTTDISLDFNDRYETEELPPEVLEPLSRHLSKLGEALELRFHYEDQLVEYLHVPPSSAVA